MSNPRPTRSPDAGANPTRQLLDDLDALMEQMLALPVNDREEAAPLGAPAAKVAVVQAPDPAPLLDPPQPVVQGPHVPPVPAGKIIVGRLSAPPSAIDLAEAAPSDKGPGLERAIPQEPRPGNEQPLDLLWGGESAHLPDNMLPPVIEKPTFRAAVGVPRRRRPISSRLLQPLIWLNQTFDHFTQWFGSRGKWLRSASGRRLLGSAGLTLLTLAAAWWLHDRLGWTWFQYFLE